MAVEFRQETDDEYDLWVDGRIADYEILRSGFEDALRRARVHDRDDIYVEDRTGYRQRLPRRRRGS